MNTLVYPNQNATAQNFTARAGLRLVEPPPALRATLSKAEIPANNVADEREKIRQRANVVVLVLILMLAAAVSYFRFAPATTTPL